MIILKIKEAITHYNDNRDVGEAKMTQRSLGGYVLPDHTEKQQDFYISRWCKGEQLSKLKPHHIILICLKTGVDPNTLYDWEVVKQNENLLKDGE